MIREDFRILKFEPLQINKRKKTQRWSTEDIKLLYSLAKRNATLKEVIAAFPDRTEQQIRHKLYLSGYTLRGGFIAHRR